MRPVFAADSVGKSFRTERVLKAASVWAEAGTVVALLGRNGSGKSTLLRIGAGVLAPDYGTVRLAGRTFTRPRLHVLARLGLFFLPDRGLLSPRLTLDQHFAAQRARFDGPGPGLAPWQEWLNVIGLLPAFPRELSTGERRRAEVALAWARAPLCLLADEPLLGLAPKDAETIAAALQALAAAGCAVVVTGHEVPELLAVADQVVWMVAGTTHGLGTPDEALRHEQFRREYIGPGPARVGG